MYYAYVLQSLKDRHFYIGYSTDLRRRLNEHKTGGSISTKNRQVGRKTLSFAEGRFFDMIKICVNDIHWES